MHILLSSGVQKRYRDNIAACMAAPVGASIQFRYGEGLVAPALRQEIKVLIGKDALVCFIDIENKMDAGEHPILPIRNVVIDNVWHVGSTIIVNLQLGGFAHAPDVGAFYKAVHAGRLAPRNASPDAESADGYWLFEQPEVLKTVTISQNLKTWEAIVEQLGRTSRFTHIPFFWAVLGLQKGTSDSVPITGEFLSWPREISCDTLYTLTIYVRRPGLAVNRGAISSPESLWIGQLIVRTDPPNASLAAAEIAIDSPYDLKRWSFQIKRPSLTFRDSGWMRIGEEALDSHSLKPADDGVSRTRDEERRELRQTLTGSPEWEIELPLTFNSPWRKVLIVGLLLGALLAAPSLISIMVPSQMNHYQKAAAVAAALLTAVGASVLAIFQIKKPT